MFSGVFKPGEFPGFSLCLLYSRLEAGIWKCQQQEQTKKSQQNTALSSKRRRKRAVSLAGQKLLDNAYFTQAKHHSNTAVTLPHPPAKALGDSRLPLSQSCDKAAPIPTEVVSGSQNFHLHHQKRGLLCTMSVEISETLTSNFAKQ